MLINNLVLLKGFSGRWLLHEFPQKGGNKNGLDVHTYDDDLKQLTSVGAKFKQSIIDKAIDQCMAAKAEGICSCTLKIDYM